MGEPLVGTVFVILQKRLGSACLYVTEDFFLGIYAGDASHRQCTLTLFENHELDISVSKKLKPNLFMLAIFPQRAQIAIVVQEKRWARMMTNLSH